MHFIIGFAILVAVFALFPRTAKTGAALVIGGGLLLVIISFLAQH